MLWNVIDRRTHPHRWLKVTAIIEPTWHDNSCEDSDQAPRFENEGIGYDEREVTSIVDAVNWANDLPYAVTLYLYDEGEGINVVPRIKAAISTPG